MEDLTQACRGRQSEIALVCAFSLTAGPGISPEVTVTLLGSRTVSAPFQGLQVQKILQMLLLWFTCLMASEVSLSAKDHRQRDREREKGPGVGVAELWVLQLA